MFDYVSSPHYLAEIQLYFGLAVVLRGQSNGLLMLLWVVSQDFESYAIETPVELAWLWCSEVRVTARSCYCGW